MSTLPACAGCVEGERYFEVLFVCNWWCSKTTVYNCAATHEWYMAPRQCSHAPCSPAFHVIMSPSCVRGLLSEPVCVSRRRRRCLRHL